MVTQLQLYRPYRRLCLHRFNNRLQDRAQHVFLMCRTVEAPLASTATTITTLERQMLHLRVDYYLPKPFQFTILKHINREGRIGV
jgi:hypothetical protein